MEPRDEALAHAIVDASIRRWITIEYMARGWLRRGWATLNPEVSAALLAGASQMLFFDRIPTHAAIDQAVEWIKSTEAARAGGMVNAVLRRISELIARTEQGEKIRRKTWTNQPDEIPLADGSALVLTQAVFEGEPCAKAGLACSIPHWQMQSWARCYGVDEAIRIAWHSIASAPTIVYIGAAHEPVESELLAPGCVPDSRVFTGSRIELSELLHTRRDIWVQDSTSARAIGGFARGLCKPDAIKGRPVQRIIDLCAGRGTKTKQLLGMFPDAKVLACEVNTPRLDDLTALARRAEGRLSVCHAREVLARIGSEKADLVLADVPCSNSGVLARRVEARHRLSQSQIDRLGDQQKQICTSARGLLASDGLLLYATCSLERDENEAMATWISQKLGFSLIESTALRPAGGPGLPTADYADGGFAALLRKV